MRRAIAAIGMLALAACGGQSGNEQAAKSGNAAAESGGTAAAGAGAGAAAASLQAGQWEITTAVLSMEVPNMPAGMSPPTPPPTTVRTCLTPDQARAPNGGFLTGSGEGSGCTAQNMSMTGGRIQGTVQCSQQGSQMHSTMEGQFSPTSFEINQQVETAAQGMTMNMRSRTTGRRVGDCTG